MARANSQRSSTLLPAVFVAAGALLCCCVPTSALLARQRSYAGMQARAPVVARRAFVDEFQSWRQSLTEDEQAMLGRQSKYMFNKTYRGSDEFDADIPDEKIEKIGTILSKYFENEAAEYKKERLSKKQDPNALFEKSGGKTMEMTLSNNIVEVDRKADRRYYWSMLRLWEAKQKGESMESASSYSIEVDVPSDVAGDVSGMLGDLSPALKKEVEAELKNAKKPSGKMMVPEVLVKQMEQYAEMADEMAEADSSFDKEKELKSKRAEMVKAYVKAFDQVEKDARTQAEFYNGMKKGSQTKADVIKSLWPKLSEVSKKPLPPLSEEFLSDLAAMPAYEEKAFKNKFGVADKLYKSEAVDPFGTKFLLGVFETEADAKKAFDDWNKAYEESREKQLEKMAQWAKRQQAKMDTTADAQERVFQAAMAS
ncbi:putative conserved tandem protein 9 [Amphidinium carterae]